MRVYADICKADFTATDTRFCPDCRYCVQPPWYQRWALPKHKYDKCVKQKDPATGRPKTDQYCGLLRDERYDPLDLCGSQGRWWEAK